MNPRNDSPPPAAETESVDGIVFVHGGHHDSSCWQLMSNLIDLPSIAVDLPGRGSRPANGLPVTYDDCVDAVIADADAAGMDRFVLVGHSMGGLTLSRAAQRYPHRIAHLVYLAALVPPPGVSVAALLGVEVAPDSGPADVLPTPDLDFARALFAGDMTDEQWAVASASVGPEVVGLFRDTLSGHGEGIPTTYIELTQDQPVPTALVDSMIVHLGPDVQRLHIDAAHNVMLSQPDALAAILNEVILTARLATMIGRPLGSGEMAIAPDPVNQPMIRHWAAAFGDDNPLYVDPIAAAATAFGEIKAPPLMLQTWTMSTPELIGIAERGGAPVASNEDGPLSVLDRAGYVGTLATNSDYEIDRYLNLGELISASTVLETVSDPKRTRMGQGRFVTWLTTYADADGVAVGRQRFRILKFKPSGANP